MRSLLKSPSADSGECAATWATSSLLGIISFSHIDANTLDEAWPLLPVSSSDDLRLLRMSNGKDSIRDLTMALTSHPTFGCLVTMEMSDLLPLSVGDQLSEKRTLSQAIVGSIRSVDKQLPYFVNSLEQGLRVPVFNHYHNELLELCPQYHCGLQGPPCSQRPKALVVLLLWYKKTHTLPIWWLKRRTLQEGRAICIYLDKQHHGNTELQSLLQWPRSVFFNHQGS